MSNLRLFFFFFVFFFFFFFFGGFVRGAVDLFTPKKTNHGEIGQGKTKMGLNFSNPFIQREVAETRGVKASKKIELLFVIFNESEILCFSPPFPPPGVWPPSSWSRLFCRMLTRRDRRPPLLSTAVRCSFRGCLSTVCDEQSNLEKESGQL